MAKQQVYLGRGEISASELQEEERKAAAFPLNLVNKKYIHTLIYSFIFKLKHKSVDCTLRESPVDTGDDGQRYPG